MLANASVFATLPVVDIDRARDFYENIVGLTPAMDTGGGGVIYLCGGGTGLSLYQRPTPTKADHTAAAWQVDDVYAAVEELADRGVVFEQYNMPEMGLQTDEYGIAELGSSKGAWFKDPEGNILGIFQM